MSKDETDISILLNDIDTLFEPSPALHSELLTHTPQIHHLSSLNHGHATPETISFVIKVLHHLLTSRRYEVLDPILNCHPRLGAKQVHSTHSQNEQSSLSTTPSESDMLRDLNERYEAVFPGLRYVVFVNGRSREIVMRDMERRIVRGDREMERQEGIDAMGDIARDRLKRSTI